MQFPMTYVLVTNIFLRSLMKLLENLHERNGNPPQVPLRVWPQELQPIQLAQFSTLTAFILKTTFQA